jgi:SAM-dependent methyltransferase
LREGHKKRIYSGQFRSHLGDLGLTAPAELDCDFYRRSNADLRGFTYQQLADHFVQFGLKEGRPGSEAAMRDGLLKLVPPSGLVLEIGPWFTPTVRGPRVRYFDVFDTDELRRRAKDSGGNPDDCPEVHYVSPLADLSVIPDMFSAGISSHVIEHQPDLVRHLNKVADLLEPGGLYFLMIPDKRYCFDHFLPVSTIADVLDAHIRKRMLHDPKSILEYRLLRTHNEPMRHWKGDHGFRLIDENPNIIQEAIIEASRYDQEYIDCHAWRFTPDTFRSIITTLSNLKLTPMEPLRVYNSVRGTSEFTAILQKR